MLPHDQPDLLDVVSLAQVGVNQQRTVFAGLRFTVSQHLENNVVARLQHRADGWYLVGFVGDEMNVHSKANRKSKSWPLGSKPVAAMQTTLWSLPLTDG